MSNRARYFWLCLPPTITVVVGLLFVSTAGQYIIESAYRGESLSEFNELIANSRARSPATRDLAYFQNRISGFLHRGVLVVGIVQIWCLLAWTRGREFFSGKAHPYSLAVFRMVVFALLVQRIDPDALAAWSRMPSGLQQPPIGMRWFASLVPISESWLLPTAYACIIASWLSVIGLFTRPATWIAALLSIICLGVPQLYGKVSHYHDLAWFALLLAAAPCGAAISVDSTLAAWREAACGRIPHVPVRSRAIGLPLRLASLVLGIIYFFPGIWKFWFAGIRWAIGDNLKFTMYQKWVSIEGWTPAIRIDQYPWAYQLGGVLTVLFEIAFVFLVLFRNGRVLAAVAGVCFHSSTRMFLLIASYIPYYYVCLFDWDSVFARAGRAIGLRPIRCTIRTGNTRLLQLLAVAKSVDLFGCLNLETAPSTTVESLRVCDQRTGELIATGTTGLRAALTCVLVLWPMAFAMRTRLVRDFVKEYLLAANVNYTKAPSSTSLSNVDAPISKSLVVVAIFLLVGNSFFGFLCIEKAWPLCCYPTFRGLASKTRAAVAVMVEYPDGTNRQIDRTELRSALGMTRVRFDQMMKGILTDPSRTVRAGKLEELWEKAILTRSDLEKRSTVHFYAETLSVAPAEWKTNPISRTEIHKYEIRPQ